MYDHWPISPRFLGYYDLATQQPAFIEYDDFGFPLRQGRITQLEAFNESCLAAYDHLLSQFAMALYNPAYDDVVIPTALHQIPASLHIAPASEDITTVVFATHPAYQTPHTAEIDHIIESNGHITDGHELIEHDYFRDLLLAIQRYRDIMAALNIHDLSIA